MVFLKREMEQLCAGTASSDLCVPVFAGEKGNPGRIFVPGRKSKTFATQSICDLSMEAVRYTTGKEELGISIMNDLLPSSPAGLESRVKKDKKSY
jgi:hypothetical protein